MDAQTGKNERETHGMQDCDFDMKVAPNGKETCLYGTQNPENAMNGIRCTPFWNENLHG